MTLEHLGFLVIGIGIGVVVGTIELHIDLFMRLLRLRP